MYLFNEYTIWISELFYKWGKLLARCLRRRLPKYISSLVDCRLSIQ